MIVYIEGTVSVNKVGASSSIPVANPTPQIESVKPVTSSIIQSKLLLFNIYYCMFTSPKIHWHPIILIISFNH